MILIIFWYIQNYFQQKKHEKNENKKIINAQFAIYWKSNMIRAIVIIPTDTLRY